MAELTVGVNWLAVIIGFVLAWLLGWVWYSPKLFGTKWAEGKGVDLGTSTDMPVAAMVAQAVGTFGLAWLVGITAKSNHLLTIILVLLTFAFLVAANGMFGKSSSYTVRTEVGFIIAMGVIMIATQGVVGSLM